MSALAETLEALSRSFDELGDVRGIVSALGEKLDVEQVRETLRLLETALDQSDLLPVFEQALTSRRSPTA